VSADDVQSHRKFADKYELPFPLLADVDHSVAEAYGVWKEKSMYGKKYMGIERTTYVIGPDGKIRNIYNKVKPAGHAAQILADLSS
jgi:peroxiredoxin Q/BCP